MIETQSRGRFFDYSHFPRTLLTQFVDLMDAFQIGASEVAPKNRLLRTANQDYEVNGYECSATSPLRPTVSPTPSELLLSPKSRKNHSRVCHSDDETQTDGKCDLLMIFPGHEVPIFSFEAGNVLMSYDFSACEGLLVCKFSTII
jgi:hypothetical protein